MFDFHILLCAFFMLLVLHTCVVLRKHRRYYLRKITVIFFRWLEIVSSNRPITSNHKPPVSKIPSSSFLFQDMNNCGGDDGSSCETNSHLQQTKTSRKITHLCFHCGNYGHDKVACPSKEDDESEVARDGVQCYLKEQEVRKHSKCFPFFCKGIHHVWWHIYYISKRTPLYCLFCSVYPLKTVVDESR